MIRLRHRNIFGFGNQATPQFLSQQETFSILRRVAVAGVLDLGDLVYHRPPFRALLDVGRVERSPGELRVDR